MKLANTQLLFAAPLLLLLVACESKPEPQNTDIMAVKRRQLVHQIRRSGVSDKNVLNAMRLVPRHLFLHSKYKDRFYEDVSIPITPFTTTPKPSFEAAILDRLNLKATDKVLEIGTGIGYQTAVMAEIADEVVTIEIVPTTSKNAEETLTKLGYKNIHVVVGDGYKGFPEKAPYNVIVGLISADEPPQPLLGQLADGGRLIMAINTADGERLKLFTKTKSGLTIKNLMKADLSRMEGKVAGHSLQ